jgi:putative endonuclease
MYSVNAIKSKRFNYIYVGISNDVQRRIDQHNKGQNKSTKPYRPFFLFYEEHFRTRDEARIREKFLKNASGKRYLRKVLQENGFC